MQIAICEDNAAHLKRIVDLLHQHFDNILSYTVHTFCNGKSFLAFARNHQIDIIIMDIDLDGGSGIEIVKRFKRGGPPCRSDLRIFVCQLFFGCLSDGARIFSDQTAGIPMYFSLP